MSNATKFQSGKHLFLILFIVLFSLQVFAVDNFAGNCLDFDGVDEYVQVNATVIPASGDFTVVVWVKADAGLTGYREILSQNAGTGGQNFYLGIADLTGNIRVGDQWGDTAIGFPTDNQWHYFTVTKNSSNTWLYVDGTLASTYGSAITNPAGSEFRIGRQYGSHSEYFPGLIEELSIWNVCLDSTQINNTMNSTLSGTETGLVSYWQFNESNGTIASDAVGTNDGTLHNMEDDDWVISTAPVGLPTPTTTTATSITQTSASSGGEVTFAGGYAVTARGVCWSETANPTLSDPHTTDGTGTGSFTSSITGLTPSTEYYYRAYATNSLGTSYGEEYTFTTLDPALPTLTTTTATSITQTSASSGGNITSDGGYAVTARGVCWSETVNPTLSDPHTTDGTGEGVFTSLIDGLVPITDYYYRAYATNSLGTSYGNELTFSTTPQGSGTSGDPYQIATLTDLRWLSEHSGYWDSHFIQTTDIDASATSSWNGGEGFIPIGNEPTYFEGTYNGQEYTIDGLYINRPNYLQGLFGCCNDATIENLGVTNVDMSGYDFTGGLVGYNHDSDISNCYSTGSVSGNSYTGGLVGYNSYSSTIGNCYSTGSVSGTSYTGGLVGYNDYSTISNCYSTGSVSGSFCIGGLVGENINSSTISNCYSTGSVSATSYNTGGLVGNNDNSTISNCYSTGSVSGSSYIGGLVGNNNSSVNNSFWDTETSGQATSAGGTGKTTAEMQTESTFTDAGWDFTTVWDIEDYFGINYPFLRWQDSAPEGSIPNTPQNIQIDIIDPDAIITWDAVTESIDGISIVVDGYVVLYSENNVDFFFLVLTIDTSYTHDFVVEFSPQMLYQVIAIKNYSTRELEYLKELNNSREKLKWSEVKRNLERIKNSPQRR
jgi:hypothetical protein